MIYLSNDLLWKPMENGPFIDDLPLKKKDWFKGTSTGHP